jgi:hypothetical protein
MLGFKPFGGSFVILIPFCRIVDGKHADGYEVKNNLNEGCVAPTVPFYSNDSQIYSRVGIQDG